VGYSLTGIPADHLVICFGAGRNGKSTLISAIQDLLGDYAAQTQVATLKPQRPETIRNDLARLFGKRFVGALEQTEGGRLDEGLVKQLTGGDRVVTRFLYQEHQELVPTFKVWMGVNHKPEIKDTSQAMWERVFLIPFEAYFPREKADQHMLEKLQLERPGILDWAIEGCLAWQQQGLNPPESVKAATAEYREESDVISRFVEDECIVGEGESMGATALYNLFVGWCGSNDQSSMSQTAFGTRLAEKGYRKKPDSKGRIVYQGIGLRIKIGR
jgi:putative DNA primase/helicase